MHYINLNIKKDTFKKNLLLLGIDIKIIEFDKFILKIKRIIGEDIDLISKSIKFKDNYRDKFSYMFGDFIPNILYLRDYNEIKKINIKYFVDILNSNELNIYLDNEANDFSEEIYKNAYLRKYLEFLSTYDNNHNVLSSFVHERYPNYFKNSILETKSIYLAINNQINISSDNKFLIREDVNLNLKDFILSSLFYSDYNSEYKLKDNLYFSLIDIYDYKAIIPFLNNLIFNNDFIFNKEIKFGNLSFDKHQSNLTKYISTLNDLSSWLSMPNVVAMNILNKLLKNKDLLYTKSNIKPNNWNENEWQSFINGIKNDTDVSNIKENINSLELNLSEIKYIIEINNMEKEFSLKDIQDFIQLN